jgi:hypothetical protein
MRASLTGGLVVRWVTTSEYPLLYVFVHAHSFAYIKLIDSDANPTPPDDSEDSTTKSGLDRVDEGLNCRARLASFFATLWHLSASIVTPAIHVLETNW